jgi:hypothetical protein
METRGSIRFLYGANRNSALPIVGFGPQEGCPRPPMGGTVHQAQIDETPRSWCGDEPFAKWSPPLWFSSMEDLHGGDYRL